MESTIPIRTVPESSALQMGRKLASGLKKLGKLLADSNAANPTAIRCGQMDRMMRKGFEHKVTSNK